MLEVLTQLWLHSLLWDEPSLNKTFAWPRGHSDMVGLGHPGDAAAVARACQEGVVGGMQEGLGQRGERGSWDDTGEMGRDRDTGTHVVYRIPGCFGPSQSTTTLKEVVFQDRLMSECPEVSRACQISMVMEEKKDQYEHSCRRVYQGQLVSLTENCLL